MNPASEDKKTEYDIYSPSPLSSGSGGQQNGVLFPFSNSSRRSTKKAMSVKMLARRPYNVYNIFFILERARLLQDCIRDAYHDDGNQKKSHSLSCCCDLVGFDQLNLPELPARYLDLQLPPDWYVPGGKVKRKHVATNGLRNFEKLAQTVASNWKVIDTDTLNYCKSVAQLIKERHTELNKGGDAKKPKAPAKKPRNATTVSEESIKSDAPKEARQPHEISSISLTLSSTSTGDIASLDARVPENRIGGTSIGGESTCQQKQWIDEIISMPIMSATLDDQRERQVGDIPTIHHASGMVIPPTREMPVFDLWNTDDFDNGSISDFRLF